MKSRVILWVGSVALTLAMFGGVAVAAAVHCSTDPCQGTPEVDQIFGSGGAETINASGGDDFVDAYGGNDEVYGGEGKDLLTLSEDSDKGYGEGGADTIDLQSNDTTGSEDSAFGGSGNDTFYAKDGNKDIINCGKGKRDKVFFDKGIDTLKNCEIDIDSSQRQR